MYGRSNQGNQGARGGAEHLARIHGTEEDKVGKCMFIFIFVFLNIFSIITSSSLIDIYSLALLGELPFLFQDRRLSPR
jgi:hypothetical protein